MRCIRISWTKNASTMTSSDKYINVLTQTFVKFTNREYLKKFYTDGEISFIDGLFT